MAWNVMLGMDEAERDYLLDAGRCKPCGHFIAFHDFTKDGERFFCLIPGCKCDEILGED
jgi:hypothetical protein